MASADGFLPGLSRLLYRQGYFRVWKCRCGHELPTGQTDSRRQAWRLSLQRLRCGFGKKEKALSAEESQKVTPLALPVLDRTPSGTLAVLEHSQMPVAHNDARRIVGRHHLRPSDLLTNLLNRLGRPVAVLSW